MKDIETRPIHYKDEKYEAKDVIREWKLNFNLGNVIKYIARNGKKADNSNIQDLKKAKQYIEFEISYLEEQEQLRYTE